MNKLVTKTLLGTVSVLALVLAGCATAKHTPAPVAAAPVAEPAPYSPPMAPEPEPAPMAPKPDRN
jgi:PBP1b-binding outer membrane lipoprotein LpoB